MTQALNYLEKVYTEYTEYKDFLKSVIKPMDEVYKEVAQAMTDTTDEEKATNIYLEKVASMKLYQEDFFNQQQRLFYIVEAYKNIMEIPNEILKEAENFKFLQMFSIKLGKSEVIDEEALNFTKEQINLEMKKGIQQFKERYL